MECEEPHAKCVLDHMIIINETSLDSKEFMARIQFWVGKSSKKIQDPSKGRAKREGRLGRGGYLG